MTYSSFITKIRAEAKDYARPMHNDFTGDGSTTLFVATDAPILEGSYILKVDGVQKTEGTDFTIDRELGLITLAVAPADTKPVTLDFKYAHLSDASWMTIINFVLSDMEGEFWREVVDDNFGNTVDGQVEYDAPTSCIDVVNWWYRNSDNPNVKWEMVTENANWRFSKDETKLHLGVCFNSTYPMKLHYLKGYAKGAATTDDLDIQEQYEGVLQLGCLWRYYDYRLAERVEISTKVVKERTVTPLQNIQALSQHYFKLYLKEKGRKKPTKPMRVLNVKNARGGTP